MYEEHIAMVRGLVAGLEASGQRRKDNVLERQVADGRKPLCEFLGKDVPDEDFPLTNMTAEAGRKIMMGLQESNRQAWTKFLLVVSSTVGLMSVALLAIEVR